MLDLDIELRRGTFHRHVRIEDGARVIGVMPKRLRPTARSSTGLGRPSTAASSPA